MDYLTKPKKGSGLHLTGSNLFITFAQMKKVIFILLLVIPIFFSCNKKKESKSNELTPVNIINVEDMKSVLEDILLAEASIGVKEMRHEDVRYLSYHYYNYVLKKHNINREQFRKSYSYYAKDTDKMELILADIIADLSMKQSKARNEKENSKPQAPNSKK
jgi:hypothetical protein